METRFFLLWLMNDCVLGLKWTPKWMCGIILQEVITPVTAALLLHTSTFGRHFVTPNLFRMLQPASSPELPDTCHITPVLHPLHWPPIHRRITAAHSDHSIQFLAPDPIPILDKLSYRYQIQCRTPTTGGIEVSGCRICVWSKCFSHLLSLVL